MCMICYQIFCIASSSLARGCIHARAYAHVCVCVYSLLDASVQLSNRKIKVAAITCVL